MTAETINPKVSEHEQLIAQAVGDLHAKTPTNDMGFPVGYYRSDLLPFQDYAPDDKVIDELFALPPPTGDMRDDTSTIEGVTISEAEIEGEAEEEDADANELEGYDLDYVLLDDIQDHSADPDELEDAVSALEARQQGRRTPPTAVTHQQSSDRLAGFRRQDLAVAFVELSYEEGYPTQPDGRPFWDRFEHEPIDAYTCFQAYLQMPNVSDGIRSLAGLPLVMEQNKLLVLGDHTFEEFTSKFRVYFQTYYWHARVRAFDYFKVAAYRKTMEHRAITVQDDHYHTMTRLMSRLTSYMENDEEFWDLMTPKVAVDMLRAVAFNQRLAAGLPGNLPALEKPNNGQPAAGSSIEMIIRQMATKDQTVLGDGSARADNGGPIASRILGRPDLIEIAQELILKMSTNN